MSMRLNSFLGARMALAALVASSLVGGYQHAAQAAKKLTIAFLMPCSTCADRFENKDKPYFIAAVRALNPNITVIANNAQGDSTVQQTQAEAALTNGASVIVTSPFDEAAGAVIVAKASAQHVPVIAYDGMITGAMPNFYVSFSNEAVGALQGEYLATHVKPGGTIVIINGAQTSAPGRQFKAGAHKVLDPLFKAGKFKLGYEADTDWIPATGQRAMDQALTKLHDKVDGVLAANDGLAGGVIASLTARHLNGKVLVTGQDATDPGLERIIVGDQSMTVYKAIRAEARATAEIAVDLAEGKAGAAARLARSKVNNGTGDVPSILLKPIAVTKATIVSTVLADGFTTRAKICPPKPALCL
jgi:D-xylose transport system substrate-binding protein